MNKWWQSRLKEGTLTHLLYNVRREDSGGEGSAEDVRELPVEAANAHLLKVPVGADDGLPRLSGFGFAWRGSDKRIGMFIRYVLTLVLNYSYSYIPRVTLLLYCTAAAIFYCIYPAGAGIFKQFLLDIVNNDTKGILLVIIIVNCITPCGPLAANSIVAPAQSTEVNPSWAKWGKGAPLWLLREWSCSLWSAKCFPHLTICHHHHL